LIAFAGKDSVREVVDKGTKTKGNDRPDSLADQEQQQGMRSTNGKKEQQAGAGNE